MKTIFRKSLESFGAIVLIMASLSWIAGPILIDYEESARAEFATPEAIQSLDALYTRLEDDPGTDLVELRADSRGFSKVKRVPREWVPKYFEDWGLDAASGSWPQFMDVLAHFDEQDSLQAIEFYGSRNGCFASRSATACPPSFEALHRIQNGPIYISLRVDDGD